MVRVPFRAAADRVRHRLSQLVRTKSTGPGPDSPKADRPEADSAGPGGSGPGGRPERAPKDPRAPRGGGAAPA
ncbi:hypothetical protein ACFXI9_05005, partial [Streptomyces sp. NPDC059243]